jgi:archaellum component FlaF (FlaF/FlaG flagellin family)
LGFGGVAVNGSKTLPVQLTNIGKTALDISNVTIMGPNSGEYSPSNLCPASLAPTDSCTIEVTFAPTKKGAAGATLVVTDNIAAGKSSIPITGTGH